jgi:hypothetical protein
MLINFHDEIDQINITPMDWVVAFFLLMTGYCGFRWGHVYAVKNLNRVNAANYKFKKVLDCS